MHVGEIIHRRPNQISDKNKVFTNQISDNQISYKDSMEIIKSLPFRINSEFQKLVAWQLRRVGLKRFTECATAAAKARAPERYLMVCLKQEGVCQVRDIKTASVDKKQI